MRVLVIGGTGFIGAQAVRRLNARGHEVMVFHRGQTQSQLPANVRHVFGDRERLRDFTGELSRFSPEVILDSIPYNGKDATALLDALGGIASRVVALSSQDVYRAYGRLLGIEPGEPDPVPLTEEAPLRERLYPYRGKLPGEDDYEKILAERGYLSDRRVRATLLRLPRVYGPGDPQHRLYAHIRRMDDTRSVILLDERQATWRWTRGYVEDVADAIALAVTDEHAAGRVYNLGEPSTHCEIDWVRAIGRAADWRGEVVAVPPDVLPSKLVHAYDWRQDLLVDTARIRAELQYRESVPEEDALARTIAWERTHPPAEVDAAAFDYAAEDDALARLREQGTAG